MKKTSFQERESERLSLREKRIREDRMFTVGRRIREDIEKIMAPIRELRRVGYPFRG